MFNKIQTCLYTHGVLSAMVIFLIWIKYKGGGYISFTAIDHPHLFTIRLYIYMYTLIKLEYSLVHVHVYVCDMNNAVRIIKHFIHVSNVYYFKACDPGYSFSDPWIPHVLKVGHYTTGSQKRVFLHFHMCFGFTSIIYTRGKMHVLYIPDCSWDCCLIYNISS